MPSVSPTDEDLQAIEARAAVAWPGPWTSFIEGRDHTGGSSFIRKGDEEGRGEDIEASGVTAADQDFIAAARLDVPRLVAVVRSSWRRIAELERLQIAGLGEPDDA